MKSKRNNRFLCVLSRFLAAPAIIISFFGSAHAANLDWDITPGTVGVGDSAITGGAGAWNTTNGTWTADAGANNVAWNNANNDLAIFGGTGGAVALGTGITANGLTFNTSGYSVTGNTLTLAGTTPTITTNADASISSILAGSASLVKAGTGQLTLTGVNTYTTATTITGGTLRLGDGTTQPTVNSTYATSAGATTKIQYNTATGATAQTWSKFTGAGTLTLATGKTFDFGWGNPTLGTGFTGTLRVEGGRVALLAATGAATSYGLGAPTKVVVTNLGHLGMWENGITLPNTIALDIAGTGYGETGFEGAIRMANGGATSTINGLVTLTGNATIGAGGTGVIAQGIAESTASNLTLGTASMGGTMELRGANTYTGTTTVSKGTLVIGSTAGTSSASLYGGSIVNQLTLTTGTVGRFASTGVPHTISGLVGGTGIVYVAGTTTTAATLNVATGASITPLQLLVGDAGIGNYSQTGGTVTPGASGLWVANNPGGSGSSVSVSGGVLDAVAATSVLGVRGSYTFTVSGTGQVNVTTLQLGHTGGTNNNPSGRVINLNGGTLRVGTAIAYAGATNNSAAVVNFNGGKLQANSSTTGLWNNDANVTANIAAGGATFDTQAFNDTISQNLRHDPSLGATLDGGITKIGSGALILSGVQTYTGPTTVTAGSLTIPEFSNTSSISVANGAALAVTGSTGNTIGGASPISTLTLGSTLGAGGASVTFGNFASNPGAPLIYATDLTTKGAAGGISLNLSGGIFTGAGSFPLVWYDNASIGGDGIGALTLGSLPRNVSATLVDDPQQLTLNVTAFNPTIWTGSVDSNWNINTTANWTLNAVSGVYLDGDIVSFDGTGSSAVTLNTTVTPSGVLASGNHTISGTGAIAGGGGITKNGSATFTVGTSNTFTGPVSINAGTLKVANANALGATGALSNTIVASGAVLDLNGIAMAAEPLTLNGTGITSGGALINSSGTAASTASAITLGTASSIGGSGNLTLSGAITGTTGLTKVGAGTLAFSSTKTYTGDTIVSGGTLDLTGGGGAGGTIRGAVTVNSGSSLRLSTGDATGYDLNTPRLTSINLTGGNMHVATTSNQTLGAAALTMQGATLTGVAGSNLDFFTSDNTQAPRSSFTTLASATTSVVSGTTLKMRQENGVIFDIANGSAAIDLDIQSNLRSDTYTNNQLVKNGAGTMRISGQSTYAYPTVINSGTLIVPSVQSSTGFTLADGTTLGITGATGSSLSTGAMTLGTAGATSINISNFGSQTLAANAPVKVTGLLTLNGTPTLNINGNFTGPGVYPVVSYGTLGGAADFALGTLPRSVTATLVPDYPNNVYKLNVTAVNPVYWNGNINGNWDTSTNNWLYAAAAAAYQNNDMLVLDDSATGTTSITLNTTVTPGSLSVNNTTKNYSIAGTGGIAGSFGFTKLGTGSLTLATANTYSGGTTVNAGTLQLGNGTLNGSVVGNIVNNASLILNNGSAQTYPDIISGTGSLTKQGAGTFSLTTAPTYTGPTTISAGTLDVPSITATSSITDNATLSFTRTDTTLTNVANVITGSGGVLYNGPVPAVSAAGQYLADDANTYGGTTTISNARVNLTHASGFSTGAVLINNGGQAYLPSNLVINNPITLNGLGWLEAGGQLGAVRLNGGATLAGPITLGSDSRISSYGGTGTISSVISGGYNLQITANATAESITFSGAASNTYTGTTTLLGAAGQLILSKTGGAVAVPGDIYMSSSGTRTILVATQNNQFGPNSAMRFTVTPGDTRFELKGTTQTLAGLDSTGFVGTGAFVQHSEFGNPTQVGPISTLILNVTGNNPATGVPFNFGNATASAVLRGQGGTVALVKNGAGKQILTGAGITYNGGTTINAGTLEFAANNNGITGGMILNGGTVNQVGGGYLTVAGFLNVPANSVVNVSNTGVNNQLFFDGGVTGSGNLTINNTDTTVGGADTVLPGVSFRNGTPGLFSGNLTVNGGKIATQGTGFNFQNSNVTLNGANWYMDGTQFSTAVATEQVKSLSGSGNVYIGTQSLTLGTNNGSGSLSGAIIGTTGTLTKTGTGTQTLSGVNTFTGATTIAAGNLTIGAGGSIDSTGSFSLASGSIFDVSATSGYTQTTGKTLSAGRTSGVGNDIVGNLTTGGTVNVAGTGTGSVGRLGVSGNLSLTGGGTLNLDLSGNPASGNDLIAAGGTLSLAGTTTVKPLLIGAPDTVNPYTLITYSGTDVVNRAANFAVSLPSSTRYTAAIVDTTTTPGSVQMMFSGTGKSLVWSGAAAATWIADATIPNAATLNWNTGTENFQNLDTVTFDDSNPAAIGTVTLNTTVSPSAITVGTAGAGAIAYTISGSGSIAAGSLTKTGTATLTLSTANSFSGGALISQGQISSGNGSALGTGNVVLNDANTGSNNTALLASTAQTSNHNIVVTNNGTGSVTLGSVSGLTGLVAHNGSLNLAKAVTINGSSDRTSINGKISGNVGTITIAGASTHRVTFGNSANDFVGNLVINSGMIYQNDSPTALPVNTSISNAGTFRLNTGGTHAVDTITGAGAINIIAGGATTLSIGNGTSGGNSDISGVISDNTAALSLIKNGSGSLTLSGANTFSGTTRLNSGATVLTNSAALSGSTLVWDNLGGTLAFGTVGTPLTAVTLGGLQGAQNLPMLNPASALVNLTVGNSAGTSSTYTGVLGGASFTKVGNSSLTLAGSSSNTYGGDFTINTLGGTGAATSVYLGKTGGALAVLPDTKVIFGTNTTGQANLRMLQNNQFGAGVVMVHGNASANNTRFDLVGTNQTLAGTISGNLTTLGSGVIQNIGLDVVGSGPGTLTLNGNTTDTQYPVGGYVHNGWIRDVDNAANALKQLNIIKNGNGTQTFASANVTYTGTTLVNTGTLAFVDTTACATPTTVAAGATVVLNRSVAGFASRGRCSGLISGAGTVNVICTTSGIAGGWVTLNAVNSGLSNFTGTVNVSSGVLSMDNIAGIFTGGSPIMNVTSGGHFAIRAQDVSIGSLTGNGEVGNYHNSTKTLTVGLGDLSGTFTGILHGNNSTVGTDGSVECGIMALTKTGTGTMTLSGPLVSGVPTITNTFSGNITVNGGKLVGGAAGNVFGTPLNTRTITVNAGATLEYQAPNTFGNHNSGNVPTLVVTNGTVTNSDPLASNKVNNGLRNVTLNNGTLTSTAGNGTSLIDGTNRPNEGYGAWGLNGTLTSSGNSFISTTATGMASRVLLSSLGTATTMNVTDGTLTISAPLQGGDGDAGGLTKTGTGRLVLSATNIYRGPTSVSAGTLELNGSLIKADGAAMTPSNITVDSGATLKGIGTATGTLAANGAIAPGNSIGTLAAGSTTFGATGSLNAEINSSTLTADKLAITGNLVINPAATLNVTDLGSGTPATAKLVLMTYTGTWDSGTFAGHADDSSFTINGNTYTLNYNDTDAGVNAVTLRIGSADPFDAWASGYGLTGPNAAKGADPDNDGVKNILEFATASDPTSGSSGPRVYPLMFTIGADNALTFTTAVRKTAVFAAAGNKQTATKDMLLYTVEASNDLVNWTTVQVTEVTGTDKTNIQSALGAKLTAPPLGADWEWHTFRTDAGAQVDPSDHIRLQVTESP